MRYPGRAMIPLRYRGLPMIALSSVFFAAMAVSARALSGVMPVGQQMLIRFLIGLVGVLPLYVWQRRLPRIERPFIWFLRGFLGGGAVYTYFLAIEHLEAGPATLLNCMAPLWAAIFAAVFLRERVGAQGIAGLFVATFGAGLVIWSVNTPTHPLAIGVGVIAGLVSAVLSGGAQTVIKALRSDTDAATVFLSFSLFGALFAAPFAIADWKPITNAMLWPALGIGLFSLIAQLLFTYAFKYTTASAGSAATQLTPAVTWMLGIAVLGESISSLAVAGAAVCIVGVMWGTGMFPARAAELAPVASGETAAR